MRTIEVLSMSYPVEKRRIKSTIKRLKELYGDEIIVSIEDDMIKVEGDLHNYKRRSRIMYILSGGVHGADWNSN